MNEITITFLLAGDKFMREMHLRKKVWIYLGAASILKLPSVTFVGVWVKIPDGRVTAEMSKTNFQNTMCNNSNTK